VQPGNAIAQQKPQPVKRIAILMSLAKDDPEGQARFNAFMEGLQKYGWTDGKNLRVDIRWTAGEAENIRASAAELAALAPDVILASGGTVIGPMMQATRTIPIVFTQVTDPVEAGHVSSLAHPGGNVTGFLQLEYSLSEKWLELLREISPGVKRVAVIRDPGIAAGKGLYDAIQKVAPTLGIDVVPANMRDAAEIERIVSDGTTPNSGLIVTPSALAIVRRDLIVTLAAKHRLPAVYPQRFFVAAGGLISYGPDLVDQTRQAASYVDRILKGEKPGDLPVQAPVKFDMALNLKTAKELGVEVPATVIARADEVIE
ncbi:MAG TPA: ABC transporter substrate-binding protein, partial [Xanthobacteraceae bacterium]|nr:ABC transporter substrate-binding protein [Xanthobacteraceae bacterium]